MISLRLRNMDLNELILYFFVHEQRKITTFIKSRNYLFYTYYKLKQIYKIAILPQAGK